VLTEPAGLMAVLKHDEKRIGQLLNASQVKITHHDITVHSEQVLKHDIHVHHHNSLVTHNNVTGQCEHVLKRVTQCTKRVRGVTRL